VSQILQAFTNNVTKVGKKRPKITKTALQDKLDCRQQPGRHNLVMQNKFMAIMHKCLVAVSRSCLDV